MADINSRWPWPANRQGQLGTYADEVRQLRQLEKNFDASPAPDVAPGQLLDPQKSSDHLRMGAPAPISDDPYEADQIALFHVIFRRLLGRRKKPGWILFENAVEEEELSELPDARRQQMRAMLQREGAMLQLIGEYNGLAEEVYARILSESKG